MEKVGLREGTVQGSRASMISKWKGILYGCVDTEMTSSGTWGRGTRYGPVKTKNV